MGYFLACSTVVLQRQTVRGVTEVSHRLLCVLRQFPLEYVLWMKQFQAEVRYLRGAEGVPASSITSWVCPWGLWCDMFHYTSPTWCRWNYCSQCQNGNGEIVRLPHTVLLERYLLCLLATLAKFIACRIQYQNLSVFWKV